MPRLLLTTGLLLGLVLLGLGGCAYMGVRTEPPRVHLVGMQLQQAELFEQRYLLRLRIQNPNDFPLNIRGLDFQVQVNGERFADGVSSQTLQIPGFGEGLAEVTVSSSLWSLTRQLRDMGEGGLEQMEYRIFGRIALTGHALPVSFESTGDLGLFNPAR
ncbi:LEA type 2 family protein [Thioalkalivibrio sulfidiphilus]|uniref:Water Stress and Hypersensitive response domain protein n=1 Tax=Thioalkalivibrio sulfidiphilus (strain HL-EbGR7) TaxID=396588 RepID=B8GRW7_THISH|nr:LEA type 2 family protein [Thioalkalivibrio sulfidiphilus]ACL72671.1 Water Stress and Hypersensitive response domain protein [Thioalkalivibrio sulfidiphilus HL-EbGr7]